MGYDFKYFTEDQLFECWSSLSKSLDLMNSYWSSPRFAHINDDVKQDLHSLPEYFRLLQEQEPFSRSSFSPGHITGSALILSADWDRVLLTHHRKLNKWLQLGGHSDGSAETHLVALREGEEESGLTDLAMVALPGSEDLNQVIPFDVDIHEIPAHKNEPSHRHYDVRFIFIASDAQTIKISEESNDLKWFDLPEGREANPEKSMQRQFEKIDVIKSLFFD